MFNLDSDNNLKFTPFQKKKKNHKQDTWFSHGHDLILDLDLDAGWFQLASLEGVWASMGLYQYLDLGFLPPLLVLLFLLLFFLIFIFFLLSFSWLQLVLHFIYELKFYDGVVA